MQTEAMTRCPHCGHMPLVWSRELPKQQGYYWFRFELLTGRVITRMVCLVWMERPRQGQLGLFDDAMIRELYCSTLHYAPLKDLQPGFWAGPIPEPSEAGEEFVDHP